MPARSAINGRERMQQIRCYSITSSASEHARHNSQAERLRALEIDDQLELGRPCTEWGNLRIANS
jgi:hypothetical protein